MTNNKNSTKYYSNLQEQHIAKLVQGECQPNSGATPYRRGDVSSTGENSWLIECKTSMTPKQSFSIKKEWLRLIREEAIQLGKMNYALAFNYGPNQENYFILNEKKFKELIDESNFE